MALVGYSDSESDHEEGDSAPTPAKDVKSQSSASNLEPLKIKVKIPALEPETRDGSEPHSPTAKRAKFGGRSGGFNSLLPPPKRAAQNAPGRSVNLKTSSEAAFDWSARTATDLRGTSEVDEFKAEASKPEEVHLSGKTTMFVPPSVAARQKALKSTSKSVTSADKVKPVRPESVAAESESTISEGSRKRPKRQLFSFQDDEDRNVYDVEGNGGDAAAKKILLQSLSRPSNPGNLADGQATQPVPNAFVSVPNGSLSAVASDLNLTSAQRRQLFGRNSKNAGEIAVAEFNLDNEYASNEALRQTGQVVQHRAVKSIAPGKHSLQQLVNNARTQKDAIEDAWAEGRRNRGEGGSKYGWSSG